jgi:hypothetical protein
VPLPDKEEVHALYQKSVSIFNINLIMYLSVCMSRSPQLMAKKTIVCSFLMLVCVYVCWSYDIHAFVNAAFRWVCVLLCEC